MAHPSGYDHKCSFKWKRYDITSAKFLVNDYLTFMGLVEKK